MSCTRAAWFATVAVTLLLPSLASSQDAPAENHYKIYSESATEIPALIPIVLRDQFGTVTIDIIQRIQFATPVSKDGSIIYDDKAHQSWFKIFADQPARDVLVTDQFGTNTWRVGNIQYLVAPAVKYPQPGDHPPVRNHYLCYEALLAPTVAKFVTLVDQFGQGQVFVVMGKMLCNPVEKMVGGVVYPIIDPSAHLACYLVENPTIYSQPVTVLDQFGNPEMVLIRNECLCTPAFKGPVPTQQSTWGRIKALYR
jgi:hypothetical protein